MPRTIPIDQNGAAARLRVDTVFGIFRENGPDARILSVDGLQTIVKLSGSGNTGSVGVKVADPNGTIKTLLDANNVHKTIASIYQEVEDYLGTTTTVLLFKGEVSSPIVWNPSENTVSWDIVSVVETEEIGFEVRQSDFEEGEIIQGLVYPNGDPVTEVPASLEGKPWPLVFGSCIHVPAVGFTLEEEVSSDDPDDADKVPQGIVASEEWFPIEPAFIAQFLAACRSAMNFDPNDELPFLHVREAGLNSEAFTRLDSFRAVTASAVESGVKAWAALVQLQKRIREVHPDKEDAFIALKDHVFIEEKKLKKEWDDEETKEPLHEAYSTYAHLREDRLGPALDALIDTALEVVWPRVALEPGHGLKRGQDPDNPNLLPGDEPVTRFYRINNAKVSGHIDTNDVLIVNDIVPTFENISIFPSDDDPTMFRINVQNSDELDECDAKVTARAVDLSGMFLYLDTVTSLGITGGYKMLVKVDKHVKVPQKDGNGAIIKDGDGNVLYEALSEVYYTPVAIALISSEGFDIGNNGRITDVIDYELGLGLILSGSIVAAAPFVLPQWGLSPTFRTDPAVKPIMTPMTWIVNEKLNKPLAQLPKFNDWVPLHNTFKLGTSSWAIKNGDIITEWGENRTGEDSCEDSDDSSAQAWTWICNQMHATEVLAVYAYRTYLGKKIFTQVPSRYFIVNQSRVIANQECTVLEVPRKLSQYEGEGWEDQLFVTMTSPVGPNTALICKWMIEEYSDYIADPTSFSETETSLANYPSHFAILTRKSLLSTLEDIAWQCRCVIYVSDDTIYMRYLAKEFPPTSTMDPTNIIEGSVTVELSITENLVTKLTGLWKPNYQDLDEDLEIRPLRRVVLRNNVDLYGVMEHEREFWIYNIRSLVVKSMKFWLIRWSNTWKRAKFETTLVGLNTETQDTFTLDLSGVVSTAPVDVIAESITYDSDNLKLAFDTWTPVRAGEMAPFDLAYLA